MKMHCSGRDLLQTMTGSLQCSIRPRRCIWKNCFMAEKRHENEGARGRIPWKFTEDWHV